MTSLNANVAMGTSSTPGTGISTAVGFGSNKTKLSKTFFYIFRKLNRERKVVNSNRIKVVKKDKVIFATTTRDDINKEYREEIEKVHDEYKNMFSVLKDEMDEADLILPNPTDKIDIKNKEILVNKIKDAGLMVKDDIEKETKRRLKKIDDKYKIDKGYDVHHDEMFKFPEDDHFYYNNDESVQVETNNEKCGSDDSDDLNEQTVKLSPFFVIKKLNKEIRTKRFIKVHERLYYHLKCKFHMSTRNTATYFNMRLEARNYLMKNGINCDKSEHYDLFSSALDMAFLISPEEIRTREMIKSRKNLNAMKKINDFNNGDLGNLDKRGFLACLQPNQKVTFDDIPLIKA